MENFGCNFLENLEKVEGLKLYNKVPKTIYIFGVVNIF